MAWRTSIGRNLESAAVSAWRQPGHALEQAPEERWILVPDLPPDVVHRCVGPLQSALCLFDAQALDILDRGLAGRGGEPALEGTFREARSAHHFLNWVRRRKVLSQPLLGIEHSGIGVVPGAIEHDVGRESVLVPLEREEPGDRLRSGRADMARDEV